MLPYQWRGADLISTALIFFYKQLYQYTDVNLNIYIFIYFEINFNIKYTLNQYITNLNSYTIYINQQGKYSISGNSIEK